LQENNERKSLFKINLYVLQKAYTYNNWEKNIPSSITFAMNTGYQYGFMKASKTSSPVFGEIIPTQSNDIFGIRADIRLTELSTDPDHASYYGLGFDLNSYSHLYWGLTVLNGQLEGNLLLYQNGSTSILAGDATFNAVLGQTYNLAIVFDDTADEYYLYLNGDKKTNFYFPNNDTSFSSGHFRMYSKNIYSRFEFDNVEFATVPEPSAILFLGLGGLFFRKRQI